ncbi:MAG: hypothetical protein WC907_08645 [Acholeplasmataceae bacterium]
MSNFISSDYETWNILIQVAIISTMLLVGNVIRRKVKAFRNFLFPTAIIAGFIGLGIKYLIFGLNIKIEGEYVLTNGFLDLVTYHAIALGFIAMGLKQVKNDKTNKIKGRPVKTGLVIVNTYLLQGIIGLTVTIILANFLLNITPYSGILLPLGFGQGPGQANNIGGLFETSGGFVGGQTFGLSIATLGFLWASVAGVFYLNKRYREDKVKKHELSKGSIVLENEIETSEEIPVSEAIDKMSIQVTFIVVVYAVSYLFMWGLSTLIGPGSNISGLIWGFNFIVAMLFAMLFKTILKGLRKSGLMTRKYTNEYMLNRITGVLFDFMVVTSIMAIDIEVLFKLDFLITLSIVTTIGGILTYFYLIFVTKKLYPDYQHEAFASLFGNLTGTASNGIALLREIDPNLETPAADNLVTGSSTAILFGFPILLITGVIYNPEWYYLWGSFILIIVIFVVFNYFMLKDFKKKEKINTQ